MNAETRLHASGFAGITASFALELYRRLLLDPVVLTGRDPGEWVASATLLLFFGSVAVLWYPTALAELDETGHGTFVVAALVAQWGTPLALSLDAFLGLASPAGFLFLVVLALQVLLAGVATAVVVRSSVRDGGARPAPERAH